MTHLAFRTESRFAVDYSRYSGYGGQSTPQRFINGVPTIASDRVLIARKKCRQEIRRPVCLVCWIRANLYFATIDSGVTGYKKISYIAEASETELTIPVTKTEALARTYLYDDGLGVTVIDGGKWSATYRTKVSSAKGAAIRLVAFLRHTDGSETTLFSATSDKIINTTYQTLDFQITQPSFECLTTDRIGFRLFVSTTHPAGVTLYTIVGDGNASYVNTPIALRHSQLRGLIKDHPASAIRFTPVGTMTLRCSGAIAGVIRDA